MVQRFFGKKPSKKYVRPLRNSAVTHKVNIELLKTDENKVNEVENNEINNTDDMNDERLAKVEALAGVKAPKRKVKIEKKDKGLIERTENSTIVLTEENKMMLND